MLFIGCIGLPDQGGLIAFGGDMTIEAVLGNIQFTTFEPFYFGLCKIPFQHLVPFFTPGKIFGHIGPESGRIFDTFLISCFVLVEGFDLIGV